MDTTNNDVTPDLEALSYGPPLPCAGDVGQKQAPNGFEPSLALGGMGMGFNVDDLLDMDMFCNGIGGGAMGMGMGMGMGVDMDVGTDIGAGRVSFSTAAPPLPPSDAVAGAVSGGSAGDQQRPVEYSLSKSSNGTSTDPTARLDAFNLTSHLPLDLEPPLPSLPLLPPAISFFNSSLPAPGSFSQPLPHLPPPFHHSFPPAASFSQPPLTRPSTAPSTSSSSCSSSASTNTSTSPSSIPPSPTRESIYSSSSPTVSQHSTGHPSPANAPTSSAIDYRFTIFSPIASPVQAASRHASPPPAWDLQDSHPPSAFFPVAVASAASAPIGQRSSRRRYAMDGDNVGQCAKMGSSPVVERLLDEKRKLLELLHTRFTASEIHNWAYSANISLSTDPRSLLAPHNSHSGSLPSPPVSIPTSSTHVSPTAAAATSWSQPLRPPTTTASPPPPAPPSLIIRIRKPTAPPSTDPPSSSSSTTPVPTPALAPPPPASHVLARLTYSIPTASAAADLDDSDDALSSIASDYDDAVKRNRKSGKPRGLGLGAAKTAAATAASAANAKRRRDKREQMQVWKAAEAGLAARASADGAGKGRGRDRGRAKGVPRSIEAELAATPTAHEIVPNAVAQSTPPTRGRGRGRPARGGSGHKLSRASSKGAAALHEPRPGAARLPPLPASTPQAPAAVKDEPESGARKRRVTDGDLGAVSPLGRRKKRQRRASYDAGIGRADGGLADDDVDREEEVEVDVVRMEQVAVDIGPVHLLLSDLGHPIMRLPSPPPDIFDARHSTALRIHDAFAAAVTGHDQGSRRSRRRQKAPPATSAKVCLPRNVRAAALSVHLSPEKYRRAQQTDDVAPVKDGQEGHDSDPTSSVPRAPARPTVDSRFAPAHTELQNHFQPVAPSSSTSSPQSSHLSAYMPSSSRPSIPSTSSRPASPSTSPLPTPSSTSTPSTTTAPHSETPSTTRSDPPTTSLGTRWTHADRLLLCTQWLSASDPADLVARLALHFPTRSRRACRHQLDDLIHGRVTCEGVDVEALKNRKVRGYVDPRYEGPGAPGRKRRAARAVSGEPAEAAGVSPSPRKMAEIVVMVPPVQAGHLQVLRKRLSSMTQNGVGAAAVTVEGGGSPARDGVMKEPELAPSEGPALNALAAADADQDVVMEDVSKVADSAAPKLALNEDLMVDGREDAMVVDDDDDDESRPMLELVVASSGRIKSSMQLNPSPGPRPLTPASTSTSSEPQLDGQDGLPFEPHSPSTASPSTASPIASSSVRSSRTPAHHLDIWKPESELDSRPMVPTAKSHVSRALLFPQAADGTPCSEPDLRQHRPRSPLAAPSAPVHVATSSPRPTRVKAKRRSKGPIRPHTAPPPPPLSSMSSLGSSRAARPAAAAHSSSSPARPTMVVEQRPHPFSVASLLSTFHTAPDTKHDPACVQDPNAQGRDGVGAEKSLTAFQSLFSRVLKWDR